MSPEMLTHESYNYKTDIWSIGTVLYQMVVGCSPFKSSKNKKELIDSVRDIENHKLP